MLRIITFKRFKNVNGDFINKENGDIIIGKEENFFRIGPCIYRKRFVIGNFLITTDVSISNELGLKFFNVLP